MSSSFWKNPSILDNELDLHKELWTIYRAIISKNKELCAQNPDQIEEINFLLKCVDSSFQISSISCQILIRLLAMRYIKQDYLLKMLLTFTATARNYNCIVTSIVEILMLEMSEQLANSASYYCPYKIRAPPHPLVTILQQRPDSFHAIIDSMKQKYVETIDKSNGKGIHLLSMIKPFVSFVLLDPNHFASWQSLATHNTMIELLKIARESSKTRVSCDIANFLLRIYMLRKSDAIVENVLMVNQLVDCLIGFGLQDDVQLSKILIQAAYQILLNCHKLLEANYSIKLTLRTLQRLFQKDPKVLLNDESLFLIASLLYQSPAVYREDILRLGMHVLPCYVALKNQTAGIVLRSFNISLLRILFRGSTESEGHRQCQKLAKNIFANIKRVTESNQSNSNEAEVGEPSEALAEVQLAEIIAARQHCAMLYSMNRCKNATMEFLSGLVDTPNPSPYLTLILSTVVANHRNDLDVMKKCLECISTLTIHDPQMALDFLPLLLQTLNTCENPLITLEILNFLPCFGKHKQLVAPILKTIGMLASSNYLLPVCIRVAVKLWKIQPRVFPHLLKLLSKTVDKHSTTSKLREEIVLAKSLSFVDICELRPHYGSETVGLLSDMFSEYGQCADGLDVSSEVAESVVMLCLEALKGLCESEVVKFTTVWIAISPKLHNHESATVLRGITSLFTICPIVLLRSAADIQFRSEACSFLWKHVSHENPHVSAASFSALANFSSDEFKVSDLPNPTQLWVAEMLQKKHNLKKRPENDEFDPRNEAIPGLAYMKLLESLDDSAVCGFTPLLSKLIKEEVSSLPRNISTANATKRLGSAYEKLLGFIPEFLNSMYEKSKTPALLPGLAAGLLSCYKIPIQVGKDEKIGRRHLVENAKIHRQMLDNCLNEIAIPQMDWQHSISASASWSNMIGKCFDAVLEGRKAELSLLFSQGKFTSEQEMKIEVSNAVLWTRDQLTNQLMKASRGIPPMQGNSILALAALASKISSTESVENSSFSTHNPSDSMQYLNNKEWLVRVSDTVMVVLNGNFKPKSEPMQWCQQISSCNSTASSLIARSSAAIALPVIATTLISIDVDRIQQIADSLASRIPGQERAGKSSVMQFSCAVGLGLLVHHLHQKQFVTITGLQGYKLIRKAHDLLEQTCSNNLLQNRNGVAIGLSLSLGAMLSICSKENNHDSLHSWRKLFNAIVDLKSKEETPENFEGLLLSTAIPAVSGFCFGSLKADDVIKTIDLMASIVAEHPKSSASSSALGILLYGSLSSGLSQNIMESLIEPWLTILTDEMAESEKRVAAICGLMSSFGSWKFLFQFEEFDTFDAALKTKLALIIKTVQQVLQTSDDTKLCLQCSKFLGIFYMVNDGYASKQANLPSNYDYLRESSLLRSAFAFLTEAGKSGPSVLHSSAKVSCVVYGLIESSSVTLPPVNWSLVFTPLMKLGFSACTQKLCLEFAIENASKFPTLRVWFLSWLTPGIFLNLEDTCKELIFSKFDSISRLVPMNKLKIVLEEITVEAFQNKESNSQLQKSVLCGLEKIANMKSPVQSSLLYVSQAIEKICLGMTIHENEEILKSIADCLVCLPKELKDVVTKNLQVQMNFDVPAKLDSILLASRKITLTTFQSSLERLLHDPEKIDASSLQRITYALQQYSLGIPPSIKATDDDIMWFLELTTRTKKLADSGKHASLRCWLKLLASAVASWCLAGIIPNIPNSSSQSNSPDYITACWDTFALNLAGLLHLSRWQHLQQRVIEWLVALLEIVRPMKEHDHIGVLLQNCLITLRDCEAWKQRGIWIQSSDLLLT